MALDDSKDLDLSQHSSVPEDESDYIVCPKCGLKLPVSISNCPDDGTILKPLGERLTEYYEFLEEIGSGGNGVVYKARHKLLNYIVAIKMLHANKLESSIVRRFNQEAKAISTLDHPNIVKLRDFGITESGQAHMVLEFLDGSTLSAVIEMYGALPLHDFLNIFIQCCDGLQHAHDHAVLHRDVKPSNIIICGQNNVKILDFGIAKITDLADQSAGLTKTGEIFGSPKYMSPEQATGKRVDNRSDIYSLGLVMFEALTGSTPFAGSTTYDLLANRINANAPLVRASNPDVPVEFEEVVSKCLAKEPFDRYQSMSDVQKALVELKAGKKKANATSKSLKKTDALLAVTGFVLLCGVSALFYHFCVNLVKPMELPRIPHHLDDLSASTQSDGSARAYLLAHLHDKEIDFDKDYAASMDMNDDVLREFDNTNVTEDLTMRGSRLKGPGLAHLIHLPLRRLCLSTGELSNRAIDEIRHIETLQILDLSGTNVDDNGLAKLATLKNLKLLYLKDEEKITNQGLENFAPMAHLEALNLSKNDWIRSSGISGLAKLPALKILRMDSCKLSAPVLVPMKKLKHLKLLALRGSNVADDGVDQLVDTTIEQLDLEKTNISDRSLRTLAKMRYLKELGLNQCSVSQSAIDKLQQERPNLRIWEHDGVPFNSRHDNQ